MNNNIIKFYFYKIYFYFINIESDRNYLDTKFKIYITDKCIEGDVSKLISFIDNIYPIEYIDVRLIYNTVDWKGYYKDLSDKEVEFEQPARAEHVLHRPPEEIEADQVHQQVQDAGMEELERDQLIELPVFQAVDAQRQQIGKSAFKNQVTDRLQQKADDIGNEKRRHHRPLGPIFRTHVLTIIQHLH